VRGGKRTESLGAPLKYVRSVPSWASTVKHQRYRMKMNCATTRGPLVRVEGARYEELPVWQTELITRQLNAQTIGARGQSINAEMAVG